MRKLAKYCWMYLLFFTGVLWWTRRRLAARGAAVVLMLHRVLPDEEFAVTSSLPDIVVRTKTFEALGRYLASHCTPVSVTELPTSPRPHSARVRIAVTFDDGWKDNYSQAFPVACRYALPITIFICPGLQGRRFPFWPERAVRWWNTTHSSHTDGHLPHRFHDAGEFVEYLKERLPAERDRILATADPQSVGSPQLEPMNATMSREEVAVLNSRGVFFGSHTQSHQILTQIEAADVRTELVDSKNAIEKTLSRDCSALAYPNGNCSSEVRDQAAACGYRLAFTTRPGVWLPACDPLMIPRVNISENKVTGWTKGFSRVAFEYAVFWKASRAR